MSDVIGREEVQNIDASGGLFPVLDYFWFFVWKTGRTFLDIKPADLYPDHPTSIRTTRPVSGPPDLYDSQVACMPLAINFLILQEGQFLLDSLVTSQLLVDCFLFWITFGFLSEKLVVHFWT